MNNARGDPPKRSKNYSEMLALFSDAEYEQKCLYNYTMCRLANFFLYLGS